MTATDDRLAWWREATFGVFIHWGLYSMMGGRWKGRLYERGYAEWIQCDAKVPTDEYEKLAAEFNPTAFDARAWARLFRRSGARYVCITAKHHDGFALFKSNASDFNVVDASPFGRDVVRELADAVRAEGMRFCFYYSQIKDWHEPDAAGNNWDWPGERDHQSYLDRKALPQLRELLTGYGPIGLIWFDTPQNLTEEQAETIRDLVRECQPDCLLNGRLYPDRRAADYASADDNGVVEGVQAEPWELPSTIAGGPDPTWGYRENQVWRSADELVFELVDVVSKGGNLLLNVGPLGDGSIHPNDAERFRAVGDWLSVNGDAIYGASSTPFGDELQERRRRYTRKAGRLYVHLVEWPKDGALRLPAAHRQPVPAAHLIMPDGRVPLAVSRDNAEWKVALPEQPPRIMPAVVALETYAVNGKDETE